MPGWATPYAILAWSAVGGFEAPLGDAARGLLAAKGKPIPTGPENAGVIGHDTTLIGWPWVERTASWLEPTVLAILALSRAGLGNHARVAEGLSLVLDRAIREGGWNYGNKAVFGRALRPQPAPTSIALLALAACRCRAFAVNRALDYLRATLPNLRAAISLGWSVLALRAHGACPAPAWSWLAEAYAQCSGRPDATVGIALLLLAAGERGTELLLPAPPGRIS
jgi:hypothetical protein